MSSQESDTQFFVDAVNAMDREEEEEEDRFLASALNTIDQEEEEDQFLAAVPYNSPPSPFVPPPPYVPPPPAVPHLDLDDPLLLIPAADPDEMASPDYDAPPSPQQVGEKPRSNYDYLTYRDDLDNRMGNLNTGEVTTDEIITVNFDVSWDHIPRIANLVTLVDVDNAMEGAVQSIMILFKDRHVRNDAMNLQMLEGLIDDIAFTTGYLAGYYISAGRPSFKPKVRTSIATIKSANHPGLLYEAHSCT